LIQLNISDKKPSIYFDAFRIYYSLVSYWPQTSVKLCTMSADLEVALRWLGSPRQLQGVDNVAQILGEEVSCPVSPLRAGQCLFNVVVLCGSAVLSNIHDAWILATTADCPILVTGGVGHSTVHLIRALVSHEAAAHRTRWIPLWARFMDRYNLRGDQQEADITRLLNDGRSEASWISEILVICFEFPQEKIWLEDKSTNCGANAQMTLRVLPDQLDAFIASNRREPAASPHDVQLLIIQDPTMQRRSLLSFLRHVELLESAQNARGYRWRIATVDTNAAASTNLTAEGVAMTFGYNIDRLVSLVVGEHQRLMPGPSGYGPLGAHFIADGGEIPPDVEAAFSALKVQHGVDGRKSFVQIPP
jgi:hypothetical protein